MHINKGPLLGEERRPPFKWNQAQVKLKLNPQSTGTVFRLKEDEIQFHHLVTVINVRLWLATFADYIGLSKYAEICAPIYVQLQTVCCLKWKTNNSSVRQSSGSFTWKALNSKNATSIYITPCPRHEQWLPQWQLMQRRGTLRFKKPTSQHFANIKQLT